MSVVGRKVCAGAVACAAIGVLAWGMFSHSPKKVIAAEQEKGQWVDPANPTDELTDGPYKVDPNWPKPLAELFSQVLGLCAQAGLVCPEVVAIDGTKMAGNASLGVDPRLL